MYTTTTSSSNLVVPIAASTSPQPSNRLFQLAPNTSNYNYNKLILFTNSNRRITPQPNPLLIHQFLHPFLPSAVGVSGSGEDDCYKDSTIEEEEEAAAVEAVSEIIQEYGGDNVSNEESYEIALNSPNYVKLLADAVRELDELEISISKSSNSKEKQKSFKEKVYEMGQQKGDKGIVPFLESVVGLPLPSAMHLSRLYLSSQQTLPHLIVKVKYVKEMFFFDPSEDYDDDEGRIGEIARRMMMRLSIPVDDDDLQQTLSFFEKTQARRGGLDMLGSRDASFHHIIQSFPRLLLLPLESRMKPMVEFLEDIGVPKRSMRNILLLYPPILFYDIEKDIKPALAKVSAENKDLGRILLKYPWILSISIQKNYVKIQSFFDTKKVVYFLKELGLDEETVGRILGRCPEIFATDIERILKKKLEFLNRIGVPKGNLPRVIRKYPELFVCDINKALLPRMNYLIKIGLSKRDVTFMVCRFSPILGYSIKEVLRPKLEFLVNTMKKPTRDVVDCPRYFSYSLDKKKQNVRLSINWNSV